MGRIGQMASRRLAVLGAGAIPEIAALEEPVIKAKSFCCACILRSLLVAFAILSPVAPLLSSGFPPGLASAKGEEKSAPAIGEG
jgi:hypothetical protein